MALRKKYQSLGGNPLSVDLTVRGRLQTVEFTGGMRFPMTRLPVFSTLDADTQKALEAYPGFNKSFALISTETIIEERTMGSVPEALFVGELVPFTLSSLVAAKYYLRKTFNIEVRNNLTKAEVIEIFTKYGLELILETDKKD